MQRIGRDQALDLLSLIGIDIPNPEEYLLPTGAKLRIERHCNVFALPSCFEYVFTLHGYAHDNSDVQRAIKMVEEMIED
jgi:hypothetical protein